MHRMHRSLNWTWTRLLIAAMYALPLTFWPVGVDGQQNDASTTLPLEPTRTITFTTDEGTWMSVDVSPDGRTLVFDLLGDLYTLPIVGGKATRITSGMAMDGQPRYSPDGTRIAFVSDRDGSDNLWTYAVATGRLEQLSNTVSGLYSSPEWSPDGSYIVATGNLQQYVPWTLEVIFVSVRAGSAAPTSWTSSSSPLQYWFGAAFGPNPRRLYISDLESIYTYDHADDSLERIVDGTRPTLSPDGRLLVFATDVETATALKVRDLETGDERWLLKNVQPRIKVTERRYPPSRDLLPGMSFTPDGRYLIHSAHGKLWRTDVRNGESSTIPFTAEVEQRVNPRLKFDYAIDDEVVAVREISDARLSPDRRRLAFVALARLWVVDYPDGTPERLTDVQTNEFGPAWSPDGRWITYATLTDSGGALYRVRSTGGETPERLTRDWAVYSSVNYTPDGKRLVAVRLPWDRWRKWLVAGDDPAPYSLVSLPADGGSSTPIAPLKGGRPFPPTPFPHFRSGDTESLYVFDGGELVSMRLDGGDRHAIARITGSARPGPKHQNIILSPSGDRAIATMENNVYVFDLPSTDRLATIPLKHDAPAHVRRLSSPAGRFIGWTADGASAYWSLGSSFFRYDLTRGEGAGSSNNAPNPARVDIRITVPTDRPVGAVVLRGGRIITMRGYEVIEEGDLLIENNRIAAVGPSGSISLPSAAHVIDVRGKTLMPGMVDIHWHGGGWSIRPPWDYSGDLLASLAYGVTTIRDPQGTPEALSYADLVAAGKILGPRIYSTAEGLMQNEDIASLEDGRESLRRYSAFHDTQTLKQYAVGARRIRQWVIMAAREQRLMPTSEGKDLRKAISTAIDGYSGHEHRFDETPLHGDILQFLARTGMTITPTFLATGRWPNAFSYWAARYEVQGDTKLRRFVPTDVLDWRLRQVEWLPDDVYKAYFQAYARDMAALVAAGAHVALGSHAEMTGLGHQWDLWSFVLGGMPPHDALRVATLFGAEAIGLDKEIGSLEKGKLADLLVLDGNPLEDIMNTNRIRYVMKNGRLYEADTLNEIWPRQRPLPPLWWWSLDPPPGTPGLPVKAESASPP